MPALGVMADRLCSVCNTRMIPPEKWVCNIDADKTPGALVITCSTLFDTGNAAALALKLLEVKLGLPKGK